MSVQAFRQMVFTALTASPAVAGGRVFDHVPERTAYPFVSLGDGESADAGSSGADDQELELAVSVWSRAEGFAEAEAVAEAIRARVHRTTLTQPAGFRSVFQYERRRMAMRDPDGLTRRVLMTFRAYMERV